MPTAEATPVVVFLFVGVLGVLSSGAAMSSRLDMGTRTIMAMFSVVAWAIWSLQATDLQQLSHGDPYYYQFNSLMYLGAAAALIMLIVVVRGAMSTLQGNSTTMPSDTPPGGR